MKFVVLHGTDASHTDNWFPWLKDKLEQLGQEVWVPDLPNAGKPNVKAYSDFLLGSGYDFGDCTLVGHSSGAVEICALLQALREGMKIDTAILIGAFKGDLGWESLRGMAVEFNYEKIKSHAKQFIVIHSDDDPYCPQQEAEEISQELGAEFMLLKGMGHFSLGLDKRFDRFPELLNIIKEKVLL